MCDCPLVSTQTGHLPIFPVNCRATTLIISKLFEATLLKFVYPANSTCTLTVITKNCSLSMQLTNFKKFQSLLLLSQYSRQSLTVTSKTTVQNKAVPIHTSSKRQSKHCISINQLGESKALQGKQEQAAYVQSQTRSRGTTLFALAPHYHYCSFIYAFILHLWYFLRLVSCSPQSPRCTRHWTKCLSILNFMYQIQLQYHGPCIQTTRH